MIVFLAFCIILEICQCGVITNPTPKFTVIISKGNNTEELSLNQKDVLENCKDIKNVTSNITLTSDEIQHIALCSLYYNYMYSYYKAHEDEKELTFPTLEVIQAKKYELDIICNETVMNSTVFAKYINKITCSHLCTNMNGMINPECLFAHYYHIESKNEKKVENLEHPSSSVVNTTNLSVQNTQGEINTLTDLDEKLSTPNEKDVAEHSIGGAGSTNVATKGDDAPSTNVTTGGSDTGSINVAKGGVTSGNGDHTPQEANHNEETQQSVHNVQAQQPDTQGNQPQQPSAQGNQPQQPSAQGNQPQQPSAQGNQPQQPSAQGHHSQQPSGQSDPAQKPSVQSNQAQPSSIQSNQNIPNDKDEKVSTFKKNNPEVESPTGDTSQENEPDNDFEDTQSAVFPNDDNENYIETNNAVEMETQPKEPVAQENKKKLDKKPDTTIEENSPINNDSIDQIDGESHFFTYFMAMCVVFVLMYVGYHNRTKVMAFVLEGKRNKKQHRSRRPNSANYHKLDSNLEEALSSNVTKNANNVIY